MATALPPAWLPVSTVTATNGLVVAVDPAGSSGSARFYRVVLVKDPATLTVGTVVLRGDLVTTNGNQVRISGNVRAGSVTIVSPDPVAVDLVTRRMTGSGTVSGPGGTVMRGAFEADLADGRLRFGGGDPDLFHLGEFLAIDPTALTLDLATGVFDGTGVVSVKLPVADGSAPAAAPSGFANEAVLEGTFGRSATDSMRFDGTASYRGAVLRGSGEIQVAPGTFSLSGELRIPGAAERTFSLDAGTMALIRKADGTAEFALGGQSALSPPGVGRLVGTMDITGAFSLEWRGPAELEALKFAVVSIKLQRAGTPGAVAELGFNGRLAIPQVGGTELAGIIGADGSMSRLTSSSTLQLGPLMIRPHTGAGGPVPVLTVLRSDAAGSTLQVQGEFLTPAENGTEPVLVSGELVLGAGAAGPEIRSLSVTNTVPIVRWILPRQITVTGLALRLSYAEAGFQARMSGDLQLAARPGRPVTLALDAALAVDVADPSDVRLDAAIGVKKLSLFEKVYLSDAQFRLQAGSRPASSALSLVNGMAGFFPKFTEAETPPVLQRSDFTVFASNVGASIALSGSTMAMVLTNGSLQLPLLFTNQPAGLCPENSSGTSVALGKDTAVTVDITGPRPSDLTVRAVGSLQFVNIALLPQQHGLAAELCRASLVFPADHMPYLTNLQGAVVFPYPQGETNRVDLVDGAWGLDGLPTGKLVLTSGLKVFEKDGLKFSLLGRGAGAGACTNGFSLTAVPEPGDPVPTLVMEGATELVLPAGLVTGVDGDTVRSVTCATLRMARQAPYLPKLDVKTVQIGGTFHLGGRNGFLLTNSVLAIENLDNLFTPSPAEPFVVTLDGTLMVADGPAFSLKDGRFTRTSADQPPRFSLGGLGYSESRFQLAQRLPVRVTDASFRFKDTNQPLSRLLLPSNVELKFSGSVAFPSVEEKLFEGTFTDLRVTATPEGRPVLEDIDGFSMLIGGMKLPPITDIGGALLVSGLSKAASAPRGGAAPAGVFGGDVGDLFMAGTVEGSYQGYKLKLLLALRTTGIVGACLDVNAGEVGIPIDGGYLGGVLLTGAKGGVALGQGFIEPCAFTAYVGPDGKPKAGVTELPKIALPWEALRQKLVEAEEYAARFRAATARLGAAAGTARPGRPLPAGLPHTRYTNDFGLPCPGDCPPPTINIFCQPHPDQARFPNVVIGRFSSIDEAALNRAGIDRRWVAERYKTGNEWAPTMARAVAAEVRKQILALTPLPSVAVLGPQAVELAALIDEAVAVSEKLLVPVLTEAVSTLQSADTVYDAIVATAYRGAPCPDITLAVSGTLTHATVSSFLSGTVGVSVSSAGVAGISGEVDVLGIPVGKAKGFIAGTDDHADPNPSLCAEVDVSVGPLSIGSMRGSFAVQGAAAGVAKTWSRLGSCIGEPLLFDVVRRVAPRVALAGRTKLQVSDALTPEEKMGVIAQLYSRPGLPGVLRACVAEGLATLMAEVDPELLFCGEVRPRLFGFPLGSELVSAGMQVTKTNYTAVTAGSPARMMAAALFAAGTTIPGGITVAAAGPLAASMFASDFATVGVSVSVPDPAEPFLGGLQGRFTSAGSVAAYLDSSFESFLGNFSCTLDYKLSPLGFKTVDAQARVVLPDLVSHPARPGSGWVRPEDRGLGLPSRLDLVLSALTNHLSGSTLGLVSDPKWKGSASDLGQAFAAGSPERPRVAGLSFGRDYFPHGGLVGGGYIQLPRALYEAPPAALRTVLGRTNDALSRLGAAAGYIQDYVLQTRQAGALGFYVPAPNPPSFTDASGAALTPRALLDSIRSVEPQQPRFGPLYPSGESYLRGFLDGRLLDVPIVKAKLEARMADASTGTNAYFLASGRIPAGSWLEPFSPGATLEFELKAAPPQPIETVFSNRLVQVRAVLAGPRTPAAVDAALAAVLADLDAGMPKVKLEAAIPLRMPAPASDLVRFAGGTWLYAYSPRFEPGYKPDDLKPVARARREGGLAMRGNLDFRLEGKSLTTVADAQLALVPGQIGAPSLSGVFSVAKLDVGGLSVRDAELDYSDGGPVRYGIRGSVTPLDFGTAFRLDPITGPDLTARLEVTSDNFNKGGSLSLSPARLRLGSANHLVHGGLRTNAFTFSTSGPWSATLELTNQVELQAGGVTFVRLDSTGLLSPVSLAGVGLKSLEFSAVMRGGSSLTIFPDTTFAQTLATRPATTSRVTVRSDGTFEVAGVLDTDLLPLGLPGLSITTLKAGAGFVLTGSGLTVDGQLGGGVLAQLGGPAFTARGRFSLSPLGVPGVTTDGPLSLPAFGTPFLALQGGSGGPVTASLNAAGLELSGARVVAPGLFTNGVPAVSVDPKGDFLVSVGPNASSVGSWNFSSLRYQLRRSGGVLAITNLVGVSGTPAVSASFSVAGHATSAGLVDLAGSREDGLFANYPISSFGFALRRGTSDVRSAVLADGPLAYWRLGDGTKTSVAVSETGSKTDGIYQDGSTRGQPGALVGDTDGSVRFSGKGGQVVVGNEAAFDGLGAELTLEAWIKVGAFDRTWNTIVSKGDSSWRLQRNGDSSALGFDTDGLNPPYLAGRRPVDDGQWHHVVATYDGRVKALWIDGQLDAWTAATGTIARNDFPVMIGENAQSTGRFWNGWIDEVAVYGKALTPVALAAHHQASGGLDATATLRIQLPGLDAVTLGGAIGSDGSLALVSRPPGFGLGGFTFTDPRVQLFGGAGSPVSLLTEGDLSFLGLPATRLTGGVTPAGIVSLSGIQPGGGILGFNFTDLAFRLSGTAASASLDVGGNLDIAGIGSLRFTGSAASNGGLALTNQLTTSAKIFGYQAASRQFVLRREGLDYGILVAGSPQAPSETGDRPFAYWRLGEPGGTTAGDSKKAFLSSRYPGTYVGGVALGRPGALAGDGNTSASFDGVDDYVEIGDEAAFDSVTDHLTIEAWVRSAGWSKAWEAIVTKGDSSWRLSRFGGTRQVSFDTSHSTDNGLASHSLPGTSAIDDNRWHHLVAVYDGIAKYLYVDGALEAFAPYRKVIAKNDHRVRIGENAQSTGRFFRGGIDEVALYTVALTPVQVLRHFRAAGGSALDASLRYAIPGIGETGLVGLIQPSGAMSVQASGVAIPVTGFTLGTAAMTVLRTVDGTATAMIGGTVATPIGSPYVAGVLPPGGNYTLESDATGTLSVGGRTLDYSLPAKLRTSGFEAGGLLRFGGLSFDGFAKVGTTGGVSFSGTTSGATEHIAFGKRADGKTPGHPYAWLDWTATATYDVTRQSIVAKASGKLTVDFENPPNVYNKKAFDFPTLALPVDGKITVSATETFFDIRNTPYTSFQFTLP